MAATYKGLPVCCWKCWWKEGSNCYCEKGKEGQPITEERASQCLSFRSKRGMYEQFIPSEMLVITSERNMAKAGVK